MTFEAHRLIQYDKGGKPLGSRKATVNHVVSHAEGSHDLTRNVALVRMKDLSLLLLEEIKRRHAPALLVVLPRDFSTVSEDDLEDWKQIEQRLLNGEINMAVWFTFDSPEVDNIISVLDRVEDKYHLSGSESPRQIGRVSLTNFLGSIRGHGNVPTDRLKNIVLVANYDTYAAVPTLAYGANDNASGLVALLQLASIFNRLYAEKDTHGSYNIVFLVTGAGRFNFQGTRTWLENADATTSGILENIDLVLCLDRLGRGEDLHLHLPKSYSKDYAPLLSTFESTAKRFKIPLRTNFIKKASTGGINEWQHEMLARKPIFSATISGSPTPNILHSESSMFDRPERISVPVLVRNIKFITEVLCRYAYSHADNKDFEVLTGEYEVNEQFVKHWINFFGNTPRMSPYMGDSKVTEVLNNVLTQYTQDVIKHDFKFDMSFTKFYSSAVVQFSAYRVKNFWFDITLSIGVLIYLLTFHITLKAPRTTKEWIDAVSFN